MIISHKHKFIFIHPNRCGGTSIAEALIPRLGSEDEVFGYTKEFEILSEKNRKLNIKSSSSEHGKNIWKHSDCKCVKNYVGKDIWSKYFVFTTVRNPIDLYYSEYKWYKSNNHLDPLPFDHKEKKEKVNNMTFSDFVLSDLSFGKTLVEFCTETPAENINGDPFRSGEYSSLNFEIDFIIKSEKSKIDFAYACGILNLPNIKLERRNTSRPLENRSLPTDELNEKSLNFIREKHQLDLKYLKYSTDYNEHEECYNNYMA
jgi:hypothetical protein